MQLNQQYLINSTLLFRSLTESTKNAGLIISCYSFAALISALMIDELGGYLFNIHQILPFVTMLLPANAIFLVILAIHAFCYM
jgi:hypothetical protein